MPRNGDGSGDNGPIDGHEILHGTSGDTTLQHTKHVAPMPAVEKGEALPGMNASGGAAAPLNDASEEFGTNAPRNEQFGDDKTSPAASGSSVTGKTTRGDQQSTSGTSLASKATENATSSISTKSSHGHRPHEQNQRGIDEVTREKAKRYVNLNEEDVEHAGTPNSNNDAERSSQRAPREIGPKEDIELLHGKTTLQGNDKSKATADKNRSSGNGNSSHAGHGSGNNSGKQGGSGSGGSTSGYGEDPMRHNAEKFVNLEE